MRLMELFELERKVEAVPHSDWKRHQRYVLFSEGGYEERLHEVAKSQGVLLIGARELYA